MGPWEDLATEEGQHEAAVSSLESISLLPKVCFCLDNGISWPKAGHMTTLCADGFYFSIASLVRNLCIPFLHR